MSIVLVLSGLLFLALGGELLVRSASRIARFLGVSPLIIGLTIVAYGTSAPELGVSLFASFQGNSEIAISNVIGSNIFNVGFILGLCALISPLVVHLQLLRFDLPIMVGVSILAWIMGRDGRVVFSEGVFLVSSAVFYTYWLIRSSRKESQALQGEFDQAISDRTGRTDQKSVWFSVFFGVVSLGILLLGSRFLVQGATELALYFGLSEKLVGLTIVAAGTSLPEVATSVMATLRGQKDIAVGNIVGSCIFNILLILGLSSIFNGHGLIVDQALIDFDLRVMVLAAVLSFPLLWTSRQLQRWEGGVLFLGYLAYMVALGMRG